MRTTAPAADWPLALVLLALLALAVGTSRVAGLPVARAQTTAALRAVVQLAAVALVLAALLTSLAWSLGPG